MAIIGWYPAYQDMMEDCTFISDLSLSTFLILLMRFSIATSDMLSSLSIPNSGQPSEVPGTNPSSQLRMSGAFREIGSPDLMRLCLSRSSCLLSLGSLCFLGGSGLSGLQNQSAFSHLTSTLRIYGYCGPGKLCLLAKDLWLFVFWR